MGIKPIELGSLHIQHCKFTLFFNGLQDAATYLDLLIVLYNI
jgi:hypothetical protein